MSDESVLTAVFTASRDARGAASAVPEAAAEGVCGADDGGRGGEGCRGRCWKASMLLALTFARVVIVVAADVGIFPPLFWGPKTLHNDTG